MNVYIFAIGGHGLLVTADNRTAATLFAVKWMQAHNEDHLPITLAGQMPAEKGNCIGFYTEQVTEVVVTYSA